MSKMSYPSSSKMENVRFANLTSFHHFNKLIQKIKRDHFVQCVTPLKASWTLLKHLERHLFLAISLWTIVLFSCLTLRSIT